MNKLTTQAILSYFWSIFTAVIFSYVVVKYGDYKEILLLIVGYISGYMSNILGVYFAANKDKEPSKVTTETNEDGSVKITEESKR